MAEQEMMLVLDITFIKGENTHISVRQQKKNSINVSICSQVKHSVCERSFN